MPVPLRPVGGTDPGRGEHAPLLSTAERTALAVIAEHVRERAGLDHVWILAHAGRGSALEEVARVSAAGAARVPEAAVRAAAEREGSFEGSLHVVAAETRGHPPVSVVGAGRRTRAEVEAPLTDLAEIAARVLAEPRTRFRRDREPAVKPPPSPAPAPAYGNGLAHALAFLASPPIFPTSRARVVTALRQRNPALGEATRAIETDIGLAAAVVAAANRLPRRPRDGIASVPAAVAALGPHGVLRVTGALPDVRPAGAGTRVEAALARIAPHAIATRAAADLIGREMATRCRDEARLVAVLHDLGKVVLAGASDAYLHAIADTSHTPERRLAEERRALALDHAAIGGVAARRLGLPKSVASAIERHHADAAIGPAAIVRLADMVVHEAGGDAVTPAALAAVAKSLGLEEARLHAMAYDLPRARGPRDPGDEPSPLTPTQQRVLQGLADRKTYKQIASDLGVSESTIRTHLHNIYGRLEVADRAQAVLLAAERGWI